MAGSHGKVATLAICALCLGAALGEELLWDFPMELGVSTYPTVYLGEGQALEFVWNGLHGVYELAQGDGVACPASYDTSSPAVLAATANGGAYTWSTDTPGTYNFACQVAGHCQDGMLVKVVVSSSLAPGPALAPALSGAPAVAPAVAVSAPPPSESESDDSGSSLGGTRRRLLSTSW